MKERNRKIRIKAIKCTAIFDALFLALFLLDQYLYPQSSIKMQIIGLSLIILITVGITVPIYKALLLAFEFDENDKENRRFAENIISSQEYTEVIPIKSDEYEGFICGLTEIAKFYAIIDENDKVKISVKFNNESEFRYLESIDKVYLKEYYKLPDGTQNKSRKIKIT